MVKPLERIGERERAVIEERRATGYHTTTLIHFADRAELLRLLLDRLLPGVPASIDLGSFVDANTGRAMGRGDRRAGLPGEAELFAVGLAALDAVGFTGWTEEEQRDLIARMRRGEADERLRVPAKDFIDRLLDKALAGYLAHPDTWTRIGFTGPAFPDGYAWIGPAEAIARHDRKPGWDRL